MNTDPKNLSKTQCVEIVRAITGVAGDYARTPVAEYRAKLRKLRKESPAVYEHAANAVLHRLTPVDPRNELIAKMAAALDQCAFFIETYAHLNGKERDLLPMSENARKLSAQARGEGGAA